MNFPILFLTFVLSVTLNLDYGASVSVPKVLATKLALKPATKPVTKTATKPAAQSYSSNTDTSSNSAVSVYIPEIIQLVKTFGGLPGQSNDNSKISVNKIYPMLRKGVGSGLGTAKFLKTFTNFLIHNTVEGALEPNGILTMPLHLIDGFLMLYKSVIDNLVKTAGVVKMQCKNAKENANTAEALNLLTKFDLLIDELVAKINGVAGMATNQLNQLEVNKIDDDKATVDGGQLLHVANTVTDSLTTLLQNPLALFGNVGNVFDLLPNNI